MQIDPVLEWQRLTEEYRRKSSGELRELARDFADLTPTAQQALRSETQSRGLGDPERLPSAPAIQSAPKALPQAPLPLGNTSGAGNSMGGVFGARTPELAPDAPAPDGEDDGAPHEYTWKTPLCNCDSRDEARYLQEALRRAGIECWIGFDGYTTSYVPAASYQLTTGNLQVLVAADQLDEARAVAAMPIAQEIVDELQQVVPEFVEPKCPKCGSDDVVLEGVDPENTWRCESCDAQWTDAAPQAEDEASGAAK